MTPARAASAYRPRWSLCAVLTLLCLLAGPRVDARSSSPALAGTTYSRHDDVTVYSGNIRVRLMVRPLDAVSHRITLWLEERNRLLSHRSILISVSRLLGVPGMVEPMHQNGAMYQRDIRITQVGMWEVLLQLRDAAARKHRIPFLLHIEPGPHVRVWNIYPLFVPVNGWTPAVSLPFDGYIAIVHASIAPAGQIRFQIRLRSQTHHLQPPSSLRLALTMLNMAMGQSYETAHQLPSGLYSARAFLSMPGAWSIRITVDRVSSTAALVVGGHA